MTEFKYAPMFQLGEDKTEYYHIPGSEKLVSVSDFEGHKILKVSKEALTLMSNTAFRDVSFMLRPPTMRRSPRFSAIRRLRTTTSMWRSPSCATLR